MKKAFTIAEVLITLGIIGIVAAMTLPFLFTNFEKKRNVIILKRAYSDLHHYLKLFALENDCDTNFANCAPGDGEFVYKFAKYLQDKQNFSNTAHQVKANWVCIYKNPQRNSVDSFAVKNPITRDQHKYYLISPTGSYAYLLDNHMIDNWYSVDGIDIFRARIFIITSVSSKNFKSGYVCDSQNPRLQYGKDAFEAFITQLNRIIPNGSPMCKRDQYYCHPLKEGDCTIESGKYNNCLQKIIQDGWEIKYGY